MGLTTIVVLKKQGDFIKMTANEIQHIIINSLAERSFQIFSTNTDSALSFEADVIGINPNGYIYEYEVKLSRSDFKAEFRNKVHKHKMLSEKKATHEYAVYEKGKKTLKMKTHIQIANRFYFACPTDLIKLDEIPSYAGLIYVSKSGVEIIKNAPLLHKNKANTRIFKRLATVLSQRIIYGCSYYTYREKLRQQKNERILQH